jgi:hypothetical protein
MLELFSARRSPRLNRRRNLPQHRSKRLLFANDPCSNDRCVQVYSQIAMSGPISEDFTAGSGCITVQ